MIFNNAVGSKSFLKEGKTLFLLIATTLCFGSCSHLDNKWGEYSPKGIKPEAPIFVPAWIKNLDSDHVTGNLPIGLQGPTIFDGIVYMGSNSGAVAAYDLYNGREIWNAFDSKSSFHSAPVVFGQLVAYGNVEGRLFARDRLSGKLSYNVDLGGAVEGRPTYHSGRLIVHTRNHKIVCLDALTGKILWAYKRAVPFLTTLQRVSRPIVHNNQVYVGFADGTVGSFSLEEGILLWERKVVDGPKFIDIDTRPLIYKNKLIVGSLAGALTIMDIKGGIILRKIPHQISRTPLIVPEGLIIGNSEGEIVLLDENLNELKKLAISDFAITSIKSWKNGYVAGTTKGQLLSVNKELTKVKEVFNFGHSSSALFGDLAVDDGILAAYSSRNRLYVFR
tara:strand:+ start:1359 stop:2531 length:1173 start_codon:yes stop_codon:yes gene_type:complete